MNDNYPRNDIFADIIAFIHIVIFTQSIAFGAAVLLWSIDVLMFGSGAAFWYFAKGCAIFALLVSVLALGMLKHGSTGTDKR